MTQLRAGAIVGVMVGLAVAGCGGRDTTATPPANTAAAPSAARCADEASDLKRYLTAVLDPDAAPKPPWPSGDAATDDRIAAARELARKDQRARDAADPAAKLKPLEPGVKPGLLEEALASCQPALDGLVHSGEVGPADRRAAFAGGIADGLVACGCHADVAYVRALVYINQRGPD
jgi:hypothetical protein|nr:hypothetical protein [Kofleriaceae bacterium]